MTAEPGDVVRVDFGDIAGHKQAGVRPAVFLHTEGRVSLVVPLSANLNRLRFPNTVAITPDKTNGLSLPSAALVFQMRAIDMRRMAERLGSLSPKDKRALNKVIRSVALIPGV